MSLSSVSLFSLTGDILLLIVILIVGILIIALLRVLFILIPAAIVGFIVWYFTNNTTWAALAFLGIVVLGFLRRH